LLGSDCSASEQDLGKWSKGFRYSRRDLSKLFLEDGPSYETLVTAHSKRIQVVSASLLELLTTHFDQIQDAQIQEHINTAVSYSLFGLGRGTDEQIEAASLLFLSIWILDDCVMDSGTAVDCHELEGFTVRVNELWLGHLAASYEHQIESSTVYDLVLFLLDRHLTLLKGLGIEPRLLSQHKRAFEFYLDSLVTELAFRARCDHPYEEYKTIRVRSSGMKFSMTLMVMLKSMNGGFQLAFGDTRLNRAIEESALYAALFNDIVSYPRDRKEKVVNPIEVLKAKGGGNIVMAIDRIHDDLDAIGRDLLDTFVDQPSVAQIFQEVICSFCAWHKHNVRYAAGTDLLKLYYSARRG